MFKKKVVAKHKEPEPTKTPTKHKEVKEEPKQEIVAAPVGLLCECGEPVAPGQNQVCAKHIRTN